MNKQDAQQKKYNYGEWGEMYAVCDILCKHAIMLCNNKLEETGIAIPVSKIRLSSEKKNVIFIPDTNGVDWVIQNENGQQYKLKRNTIFRICKIIKGRMLLGKLIHISSNSISIIKKYYLYPESKDPNSKTDIYLTLDDIKNKYEIELGYSIKSFSGKNTPTLFNASLKNTKYRYEITGITEDVFKKIKKDSTKMRKNGVKRWLVKTIDLLLLNGGDFKVHVHKKTTLSKNLDFIDLKMNLVLSNMVKIYYAEKKSSIVECIKSIKSANPIPFDNTSLYEYKIKKFLIASAFGMTAAHAWDGNEQANGGFIIVTPSLDVVMYQQHSRNDLENYLYKSCKFDRPSTSDYYYGKLCKKNNKMFIDFSFQVRFKNFKAIVRALQSS